MYPRDLAVASRTPIAMNGGELRVVGYLGPSRQKGRKEKKIMYQKWPGARGKWATKDNGIIETVECILGNCRH